MHQYLTHPDPAKVRTQQLYFLKKIHKDTHAVRPIVSGSSGPTKKLSGFVDYFLQPLVPLTNSYIKDSKSLITLLDSITFPPNITLVAIDVIALYLNIPHDEGIQATLTHLHERNPDADNIPFPPTVTKELLHTILRHNYFEFNCLRACMVACVSRLRCHACATTHMHVTLAPNQRVGAI